MVRLILVLFYLNFSFFEVGNFKNVCNIEIRLQIDHSIIRNENYRVINYNFSIREEDINNEGVIYKEDWYGYFYGKLKDCQGAMEFRLRDTIVGIEISGNYSNSIDTFKELIKSIDQETLVESVRVHSYFIPMEDSEWYYKDLITGDIEYRIYKNGFEMR